MEYNQAFKDRYNHLYKDNPAAANMLLLLFDLSDEEGQVYFDRQDKKARQEIFDLFRARFDDINAYHLEDDDRPDS